MKVLNQTISNIRTLLKPHIKTDLNQAGALIKKATGDKPMFIIEYDKTYGYFCGKRNRDFKEVGKDILSSGL